MTDHEQSEALAEAIAKFDRDNRELLETIRLFEISNAEYEKALNALHVSPVRTCASSQEAEHDFVG